MNIGKFADREEISVNHRPVIHFLSEKNEMLIFSMCDEIATNTRDYLYLWIFPEPEESVHDADVREESSE
ncbi:hypothetical protein MY011_11030 [Escherichia coli]|nr:hypothetical protein MY011_11030 [Escherichia coli]